MDGVGVGAGRALAASTALSRALAGGVAALHACSYAAPAATLKLLALTPGSALPYFYTMITAGFYEDSMLGVSGRCGAQGRWQAAKQQQSSVGSPEGAPRPRALRSPPSRVIRHHPPRRAPPVCAAACLCNVLACDICLTVGGAFVHACVRACVRYSPN